MKKLLAVALALALLVFGVTDAQAGNTKQMQGCIALSFDDGPSGEITEALLDGLSSRGVKATFFLCGYRAAQYPELVQRMAEEGHELGLHSNRHDYMQHMTKDEALDDLLENRLAVTEASGVTPVLFRPPGGLYSPALLDAAKELGLSHTDAGDIVLMHDLSEASVAAALSFIDTMRERGYEFCTVSELAALTNVKLAPGTYYNRFPH